MLISAPYRLYGVGLSFCCLEGVGGEDDPISSLSDEGRSPLRFPRFIVKKSRV